jgi:hypothetical protein
MIRYAEYVSIIPHIPAHLLHFADESHFNARGWLLDTYSVIVPVFW